MPVCVGTDVICFNGECACVCACAHVRLMLRSVNERRAPPPSRRPLSLDLCPAQRPRGPSPSRVQPTATWTDSQAKSDTDCRESQQRHGLTTEQRRQQSCAEAGGGRERKRKGEGEDRSEEREGAGRAKGTRRKRRHRKTDQGGGTRVGASAWASSGVESRCSPSLPRSPSKPLLPACASLPGGCRAGAGLLSDSPRTLGYSLSFTSKGYPFGTFLPARR